MSSVVGETAIVQRKKLSAGDVSLCKVAPEFPRVSSSIQILLLRPANENVIWEQFWMIHQRFDQRVGEGQVVETQNGDMILNRPGSMKRETIQNTSICLAGVWGSARFSGQRLAIRLWIKHAVKFKILSHRHPVG